MIHFMYHFDYSNTERNSTMVFHAQMYSLAEKYMMHSLKQLSMEKFRVAIETGWTMDDFPLAVAEAYNSTPEDDRGLRDLVVEVCTNGTNSKRLLQNAQFLDTLKETSGFAADMVVSLSSGGKKENGTNGYKCPSCSKSINVKWSHGSTYCCIHCGHRRSDWGSFVVSS